MFLKWLSNLFGGKKSCTKREAASVSEEPVPAADCRHKVNPQNVSRVFKGDLFKQKKTTLRLTEEGKLKHTEKKPQVAPVNRHYPQRGENVNRYKSYDKCRMIQQQKSLEQQVFFQNELLLHQNVQYSYHEQTYIRSDSKSHQTTINNYQKPVVPATKDHFDSSTKGQPVGHILILNENNGECESQPAPAMHQSEPAGNQSEHVSVSNPCYISDYTADIPSYSETNTSVDYSACSCDSNTVDDY